MLVAATAGIEIGHVRLTLFSNLKWNAARSSFPAAVPIEASVIRDVSWRFISKCPFMDKCKKPGNVLIHRMGYFRLITKLQHCLQRKRLLDPPAPSFNYSLLIIHIFHITIIIITTSIIISIIITTCITTTLTTTIMIGNKYQIFSAQATFIWLKPVGCFFLRVLPGQVYDQMKKLKMITKVLFVR